MEALGSIAEAPFKSVQGSMSQASSQMTADSSIFAKILNLVVILFLFGLLGVTILWFTVVKATQITLIIAVGLISITMVFKS